MKGELKIGTSGIVLSGSKKTFPKEFQSNTRLSYYSHVFNTVEINSTFYKLPLPSTFEKWHGEVTKSFQFTCKLSKLITHSRSLCFEPSDIDAFMKASTGIREKKGCLLVQFPASIKAEYTAPVKEILTRITALNDFPTWKICVELRDLSWYKNNYMLQTLRDLNVSIVLHDMPQSRTPIHLAGNPVYIRFHGPMGDYKGSYSDDFLDSYASMIKEWLYSGSDVYVYFNNTMGDAFGNAASLKEMIEKHFPHVLVS